MRQLAQAAARESPAGVAGKVAWSNSAPVDASTTAMVCVAAWVSMPTTFEYCSDTMGLAALLLLGRTSQCGSDRAREPTGHACKEPRRARSGRLLSSHQEADWVGAASPRQADRSREEHPEGAKRFKSHTRNGKTTPTLPASPRAGRRKTYSWFKPFTSILLYRAVGPGSRQDNLRMGFKSSGIRHRLVNCRGPSGARRATEDIALCASSWAESVGGRPPGRPIVEVR